MPFKTAPKTPYSGFEGKGVCIEPQRTYRVAFARGSGSERLPESRFFVDGCFGVTFGCTTDPGSDGRGGGGLCVYLYGQGPLPSGPQLAGGGHPAGRNLRPVPYPLYRHRRGHGHHQLPDLYSAFQWQKETFEPARQDAPLSDRSGGRQGKRRPTKLRQQNILSRLVCCRGCGSQHDFCQYGSSSGGLRYTSVPDRI